MRAAGALVFPPIPGLPFDPYPTDASTPPTSCHARLDGVRGDTGRPRPRLVPADQGGRRRLRLPCCARSTTTPSPTRSTNSSPAPGWWASWAVTPWRAAPGRTRAPRALAANWPAPGSPWPPAAVRARWRPRTPAPTPPRSTTGCWTTRCCSSPRSRRSPRRSPTGRGPRSRSVNAGRRRRLGRHPHLVLRPRAAQRLRGAHRQVLRQRHPRGRPAGRSNAGVVFLPGAAGTVQEIFDNATPNYYESRGEPTPMVLVGWRTGRRAARVAAARRSPGADDGVPDRARRPDRGSSGSAETSRRLIRRQSQRP